MIVNLNIIERLALLNHFQQMRLRTVDKLIARQEIKAKLELSKAEETKINWQVTPDPVQQANVSFDRKTAEDITKTIKLSGWTLSVIILSLQYSEQVDEFDEVLLGLWRVLSLEKK